MLIALGSGAYFKTLKEYLMQGVIYRGPEIKRADQVDKKKMITLAKRFTLTEQGVSKLDDES